MKTKQLIEMLLKDLDPKAEIEVVIKKAEEDGKNGADLFDAGYQDGKFLITIMEWI